MQIFLSKAYVYANNKGFVKQLKTILVVTFAFYIFIFFHFLCFHSFKMNVY